VFFPSAVAVKSAEHTGPLLTPTGAGSKESTERSRNLSFSRLEPSADSIHQTGSLGAYFPSSDCRVLRQCGRREACLLRASESRKHPSGNHSRYRTGAHRNPQSGDKDVGDRVVCVRYVDREEEAVQRSLAGHVLSRCGNISTAGLRSSGNAVLKNLRSHLPRMQTTCPPRGGGPTARRHFTRP